MNILKRAKYIVLAETVSNDDVFTSRYDLGVVSRLFRYGYLMIVIALSYIYFGYLLSFTMALGLPILYVLENMRIVVKVENENVVFDTPFFGVNRKIVIQRSEIKGLRFTNFSNRIIIDRNGEKSVKIMASLPPGITAVDNELEEFLRSKLDL